MIAGLMLGIGPIKAVAEVVITVKGTVAPDSSWIQWALSASVRI